MALSDPQSVTISGSAISLPRVSTGENKSIYTSSDGAVDLTLSSTYGNRVRRVARLDHSKFTADPFIPADNREVSMSCYLVFDSPTVGYTNAELKANYVGFNTLYTASTHALIDKLLGGES